MLKTGYGRPPRLVTPHGATALRVPSPLGQLLLWAAGGEAGCHRVEGSKVVLRKRSVALSRQDRLLELQGFPGPKRFAWLRVELARGRALNSKPPALISPLAYFIDIINVDEPRLARTSDS